MTTRACACGSTAGGRLRRGLCRACYMRERAARLGPCAADGCDNQAHAKGLCNTCYQWTFRQAAVDYIAAWKSQGCVDCPPGTEWQPEQIDADHIGAKSANVSRLIHGANSRTLERVQRELALCVPRCRNHHRQVTYVTRSTTGVRASRSRLSARQKMVWDFKELHDWRCVDCLKQFSPDGGWTPAVIELDHLPGFPKVAGLGEMSRESRYSREDVALELQKTEPVCACCHALRSTQRDDRLGYARTAA